MSTKILISITFILNVFINNIFGSAESEDLLNGQMGTYSPERPAEVRELVDIMFNTINVENIGFRYYGDNRYKILDLNDENFMIDFVRKSNVSEMVILDIGAGSGAWGSGMSDFLSQEKLENKKIHFISVNGEVMDSVHTETDFCTHHLLGSIKIENIDEECAKIFSSCNLPEDTRFDLVVSKMTFLHLSDPLGTFLRTHKMVKIGGYMLMEGFPVYYSDDLKVLSSKKDSSMSDLLFANSIVHTLSITNEPFVCRSWGYDHVVASFMQFLMRKTTPVLILPLEYSGSAEIRNHHVQTKKIPVFIQTNQEYKSIKDKNIISDKFDRSLFYNFAIAGDKEIYDTIINPNMEIVDSIPWVPLFKAK